MFARFSHMPLRFCLAALTLVMLSACSETTAQDPVRTTSSTLTEAQLVDRVAEFEEVFISGDYDKFLEISIPPALLKAIAESSGINSDADYDEIREQFRELVAQTLSEATILSFDLNTEELEITKLSSGRQYALIPSTTEMIIQRTTVRSTQQILAIVEEQEWHLINPSNPDAITIIKRAFPDTIDIPLSEPKVEVLAE